MKCGNPLFSIVPARECFIKWMSEVVYFSAVFTKKTQESRLPVCFSTHGESSERSSSPKRKNSLLLEQILYLKKFTHIEKGGKHENDRIVSPESVSIHLQASRQTVTSSLLLCLWQGISI